jgi:hypothetical protein
MKPIFVCCSISSDIREEIPTKIEYSPEQLSLHVDVSDD